MLGGNLGSLLYGDVSVMILLTFPWQYFCCGSLFIVNGVNFIIVFKVKNYRKTSRATSALDTSVCRKAS